MTFKASQKIGKPRFDPTQRLLHRFYEPLVLLRILDPTRGDQKSPSTSESKPRTQQEAWRRFLDQLSWTCDYEPGGNTVSAIAAQNIPTGPVFWLAANSDPSRKAKPHLIWLLERLESSYELTAEGREGLIEEITSRCIEFSRNKVKNYIRRFCCAKRHLEEHAEQISAHIGEPLLSKLRALEALKDNHRELCRLAYSYLQLNFIDSLPPRQSATAPPTPFSELRHYVGRLCSWSKAARILVEEASSHPNLISNHRVDCLIPPPPGLPPAPDGQTNLNGALRRMLPSGNSERLRELQESLKNSRLFDVSTSFYEAYTDDTFKPRVHAEMQLLEYFYHLDLDFVENDRYIGSSKPSCYCCDLYLKAHPGNFVVRPCSGNLWTNWKVPVPPIQDEARSMQHTKAILNEMVQKIRKDVLFQIESKLPRRPRVPDSTTGISSDLLGLHFDTSSTTDMPNRRQAIQNPLLSGSNAIRNGSRPTNLPAVAVRRTPVGASNTPQFMSRSVDAYKVQKRARPSDTSSVQEHYTTVLGSEMASDHDDEDNILFRPRNMGKVV